MGNELVLTRAGRLIRRNKGFLAVHAPSSQAAKGFRENKKSSR
jgi:hypothetical protein